MNAIGDGVARGVAASDGEGDIRNVGRVDPCAGKLLCESHGDTTGARANICYVQAFATEHRLAARANFSDGEAVEGDFDDMLGFRAGNQNVRRDFKFESPEFLFAGEVLRGLAAGAAGEQGGKEMYLRIGNYFFRMRIEPRAVAAERVHEEKLGRERVRWNPGGAQLRKGFAKSGADDERRRLRLHPKSFSF